jgi:hypothetical protein
MMVLLAPAMFYLVHLQLYFSLMFIRPFLYSKVMTAFEHAFLSRPKERFANYVLVIRTAIGHLHGNRSLFKT